MNCNEVREKFLKFFESKKHTRVASSPLLIENDPTLLFTNAGMNQFKDVFTGAEKRDYNKACSSQKCLRISGKHNDFENVGVTARHHTFFEMLGNFSFGDYFKEDAIKHAWEFSVDVLGLDKSKIWVTVFEEDDEALELWVKLTGIDRGRVLKMGEDENYWSMGATGPCGPCSELHYYVGPENEEQSEEEFRKDDGRYLEFWNLVFMQFEKHADGTKTDLPKPSVDTGMGLERMTAIVGNAESNYECDELKTIINLCEKLSTNTYKGGRFGEELANNDEQYLKDVAMRVIADHSRAITFLIAEGLTPGSDGRSYVLRRLVRRAVRHSRVLKFDDTILDKSCKLVIDSMYDVYPLLKEKEDIIIKVVKAEELKFKETIDAGLEILESEVKKLKKGQALPGTLAFLLHDTYGFPIDLTQDALKTHGVKVDVGEFDKSMSEQKERSRGARADKNITYESLNITAGETAFKGYESLELQAKLEQIIPLDKGEFQLLFNETPFYAESGGQVSDSGEISGSKVKLKVYDVQKVKQKYFLHKVSVVEGSFDENLVGKTFKLSVDKEKRKLTASNHSATHLVHAGLRKVLGAHVKQAGSRVDENSLRFDYSHFEQVTDKELKEIEDYVNLEIINNHKISTLETDVEDAKAKGALAFFGDKYGDTVRMVSIGPNSKELCGGTHAKASGEIGLVHIKSEGSIAAGVRRIECVSGRKVLELLRSKEERERKLANLLRVGEPEIEGKVSALLSEQKELQKELSSIKLKNINSLSQDYVSQAVKTASGIKVLAIKVEDRLDKNELRKMVDSLRVKLKSGVVALVSVDESNKALLVSGATSDLAKSVHVGNLVKEAASIANGKGGGRADFAQAGGLEVQKLDQVLDTFRNSIN